MFVFEIHNFESSETTVARKAETPVVVHPPDFLAIVLIVLSSFILVGPNFVTV